MEKEGYYDLLIKAWERIKASIPDYEGACPKCGKKCVEKAVWNPLNSAPMREYGCVICNYKWGKEYFK
jgi:hypothetical protein